MTTHSAATEGVDQFINAFDLAKDRLAEISPSWLMELRRKAIDEFASKGFPTAKVEAWRQTSTAPIRNLTYATHHSAALSEEQREDLECRLILSRDESIRIVLVNGQVDPELSSPCLKNEFARVMTIPEALRQEPLRAQTYLCAHARIEDSPFTALNTALFEDGVFAVVNDKAVVDRVIYVVHVVAPGEAPLAIHPRNCFVAGDGSEMKILEHFVGVGDIPYFCNAVTEIYAGENASVQHYKLQQESPTAFHIATLSLRECAESNVKSFSLAFGSALARTDIVADLAGENIDCTLNGLYLGVGKQHIDHHTRLEHAKPHCHSTEVYKGILDDKATAVFVGLIHVHPDAQKTDAIQSSKCVLMSQDARVDSQPQLRIFADDVKCTHGAAIGQLDEDAVFYLRSRGIDEPSARGLLTYAFANDIIERIRIDALRQRLTEMVSQRFHAVEYAELE